MKERVAIYCRVSTDEQAEGGHSLDEQARLGREAVTESRRLVDVFSDPGYSGASDQRPGLQQMLDRLDEIDVIVVWAMDRLARDVELFARLTKLFTAADVRIESLTGQVDLSTSEGRAMAGFTSVIGQLEREKIAERVRMALAARKRKGQHNGGPAPDGWMDVQVGIDEKAKKPISERVHDPERAPVIRHLFDLADRGMPDAVIARQLNEEGYRTRSGLPWTRRLVQAHVTNAWHAGKVVLHRGKLDEEVFDGQHEPLVDPTTFDRIQKRRAKRDKGAGQHVQGRPAHRHLLAKMAGCGECGSPIFCTTSAYRRKSDGGRARQYACRGYKSSDGTCDLVVNAEAVDAAVLENLPRLMPDFDQWIRQIEDRHTAERELLTQARDKAAAELAAQRQKLEKVEDNYLALDSEEQEKLRGALDRARADFDRCEVRLQATKDALLSVPEDVPHDRLLDFASTLRAVIAGKLDGDHSVGELNRALGELFVSFRIYRELPEELLREGVKAPSGDAIKVGSVYICPILRREVFWRLVAEYDPDAAELAPPLEWIEALAKSANTHE